MSLLSYMTLSPPLPSSLPPPLSLFSPGVNFPAPCLSLSRSSDAQSPQPSLQVVAHGKDWTYSRCPTHWEGVNSVCHPRSKVLVECWGYQPSLSQCRSHRHQMKYQEYLASSSAKVLKISEFVCVQIKIYVSEWVGGRMVALSILSYVNI